MSRFFPANWPLIFLVWVVGAVGPVGNSQATGLTIDVGGAAETVFSWQTDRCDKHHIPDAPARAYRDFRGMVHLFAAHHGNRAMVGGDLSAVTVDCSSRFRGNRSRDPHALDDHIWLAGFHTDDGKRVIALGHAEFHGHRNPTLCPAARYKACWRNAVIAAVSRDGGRTFHRLPGRTAAVADLIYPYDGQAGRRTGYFNPSNILRWRGKLYAFIFAERYRDQRRGPCLLRADSNTQEPVWLAWDGRAFAADLSHRSASPPAGRSQVCIPFPGIGFTLSSLVHHKPSGLFIALGPTSRRTSQNGSPVSGIFYVTSRDLIHWSKPVLLLKRPLMFKYDCGDKAVFAYPSLLDETSRSRNFDTVSDNAFLFLTRFNMTGCRLPMNRDLIRFPVHIRAVG